jgi:hypothetical protein
VRVRAVKIRTVNISTRIEDQTVPIRVDKRPRWRKGISRWLAWAWEAIRTPDGPAEEGIEGTLVAFLRWENGRPLYEPFPKDPDRAVDYDLPLMLLLDNGQLWYTSPVSMVTMNRDGLPVRVETKSSEYALTWIDKPEQPPEDDGRVRG